MGILVGLEHVRHEWPGKVVLTDATCGINEGERIGIVGRNGDGKSTLLALIGHVVTPDAGSVTWRNSISVGLLGQTDNLVDDDTVGHAVMGEMPEYMWASDPRTRALVDELLVDVPLGGHIGELSGGQRRRVDLARVLTKTWDVLLLDEPTNHLDMHAIRWLARHLRSRWPQGSGALLVVTHDRWFLDEVCEQMWEVHDGVIEPFEGGYSAYIQQRVERQRQAAVIEERRQNVLRKELNWLAHGAKARTSKPKFRIEAARALLAQDPPVRDSVELRRLSVSRLGKQVIELKHVSVKYGGNADALHKDSDGIQRGGNTVLDDISWIVGPGDRVGILGENGAGKSTLLRVMCGRQRPSTGYVKIGKTVRFAVMSQQLENLSAHDDERMEELLASFKQNLLVDGKPQSPVQMAERLGFSRRDLPTYLKDLSGGQRRRLALLVVLLQEPNVLVLDEPGNDLDTDMLAVVEDLLDEWPGTLLLVTHDRYLMERVTDDQYALIDGHLRHCPGGVDEFLRCIDERAEANDQGRSASQAHNNASVRSNAQVRNGTQARTNAQTRNSVQAARTARSAVGSDDDDHVGRIYREETVLTNKERRDAKKRSDAIERRLEKLRGEVDRIQTALSSHDPTDFQGLLDLQTELDATHAEIESFEDEWLELADLLNLA